MKITKMQLKQIIREAVSNQMVEPNRVVKSLPSTYQPIQWKSMMGQGKWARKLPEKYLSPEQQEKYGDKIAKMRQTDPHQADTLAGVIVDEPTGWYDSSKSFSEEEETLIRMHSEDQIPDPNDPVGLLDRRRQSVPPTVEKLVAERNADYRIVRKAAYKIYSTSGVANPWDRDTGTNAISRLYDLINELALKDILTAKAKIEEYLTDAKYAADREEIVSNYRHTGKNGKKLLADMETLVSSFENQYKTAMNWYYTGQIKDEWYMPILESKKSYRSNKMKITKGQLKRIIREEYSKLKGQGLIKEARYNTSFPFSEIAEYLMERGYKKIKAYANDPRGHAVFQMPISIPGGSADLGYYIDIKYEYGTFYFYWYLRTKADPSSQQRIKVMKPGGGKPRWQVDYVPRDLEIVLDEIDHEISVHDAEGIHPFDQPGYGTSRFAYKG